LSFFSISMVWQITPLGAVTTGRGGRYEEDLSKIFTEITVESTLVDVLEIFGRSQSDL
jgi:hypothetical protein